MKKRMLIQIRPEKRIEDGIEFVGITTIHTLKDLLEFRHKLAVIMEAYIGYDLLFVYIIPDEVGEIDTVTTYQLGYAIQNLEQFMDIFEVNENICLDFEFLIELLLGDITFNGISHTVTRLMNRMKKENNNMNKEKQLEEAMLSNLPFDERSEKISSIISEVTDEELDHLFGQADEEAIEEAIENDIFNESLEEEEDRELTDKERDLIDRIMNLPKSSLSEVLDSGEQAADELMKEIEEAEKKIKQKSDAVNHPSHYQGNKFEAIDIIEDYNLNFNLGNAVKYILRAGKKNDLKEDLQKAVWYLQREISRL